MSKIEVGSKVITKLTSCKVCNVTLLLECFTDEHTILKMLEVGMKCSECERR